MLSASLYMPCDEFGGRKIRRCQRREWDLCGGMEFGAEKE